MFDRWLVSIGAYMFGNFDLELSFDWRISLFIAVAVPSIAVIFASASSWQADRLRNSEALKESGRGIGSGQNTAQKLLIGAQIAFTLALIAVSGLFSASLKHLYAIDLGVQTRNVWTIMLSRQPGTKGQFDRGAYYRELLDQIKQIPEV